MKETYDIFISIDKQLLEPFATIYNTLSMPEWSTSALENIMGIANAKQSNISIPDANGNPLDIDFTVIGLEVGVLIKTILQNRKNAGNRK